VSATPAPAYLVKGEDHALVAQALSKVLAELTADAGGLALEDQSGDEPDVAAIIDACLTPPFLADRRILVVRELGRTRAEDVDRLVAYLAAPSDTASLVLASTAAVPARLVEAVRSVGRLVDAAAPSGRGRGQWFAARLKEAPVNLDARAAAVLTEHLGEEVGRLERILAGLAAAYGDTTVGPDELEPFLGEAGAGAPWELTDAIDSGDAARALAALHRMTEGGKRHPLVVLASLHRHFLAMLRLDGADVSSDEEAASLLGTRSTFPAAKARTQAARLKGAGIGRAIVLLADADLDLKGRTALPEQTVLEVLVARLARLAPAVRPRPSRRARTGSR
jgi:DNA polymerase III subunit delta